MRWFIKYLPYQKLFVPFYLGNNLFKGELNDPYIFNQFEEILQLFWINIHAKIKLVDKSSYDHLVLHALISEHNKNNVIFDTSTFGLTLI